MINGLSPTLHPDYPMQTRVAFKMTQDSEELTGKIIGVCFVHVVFSYIVLLDKPLSYESHKGHDAIPVMGTLITKVLDD